MPTDAFLKVIILGSNTSLNFTFGRTAGVDKFPVNYMDIQGVDISTRDLELRTCRLKLIFVVVSGKKFFRKLRTSYYRGAACALITFDKSRRKAFSVVKHWFKEFRSYISSPLVPEYIVGLITDNERVSYQEGKSLALQLGVRYFETRPDDKKLIDDFMLKLGQEMHQYCLLRNEEIMP
ncbi:MAG: hypothetical protein ACTSPV_03880 [Candidatus Hodarchaeales archaeon]